jgi:hypothetical protein
LKYLTNIMHNLINLQQDPDVAAPEDVDTWEAVAVEAEVAEDVVVDEEVEEEVGLTPPSPRRVVALPHSLARRLLLIK